MGNNTAFVACDPGDKVVGGGGSTTSGRLSESTPATVSGPVTSGNGATGWRATRSGGPGTTTAYVVCADTA
jgi:hypothetical protein